MPLMGKTHLVRLFSQFPGLSLIYQKLDSKMRSVAWALALLLLAAVAQASPPGAKEFLSNLLADKPQLTTEQADALTGTWRKLRNSRLDGARADQALLAAVEANGTRVSGDFGALVSGAFYDPLITAFWVPAVDPQTGILAAYFVIKNKDDGKILDLQRWTGVALGQDDGSVLLSLTNSEDTAVMHTLMPPSGDRMVALLQEGLEVLQRNSTTPNERIESVLSGKPTVVDNQAVVVIEFTKLSVDSTEDEAVREDVIAELKRYWEAA